MRVIDSDNYAASGVGVMFFPGGEPHAKIPDFTGDVMLHLKARTWVDVGFGALVADALFRQRVESPHAFIPYFPGARQDRSDGTAPVTVQVMAGLFYTSRVICFDPHSQATIDALPSVRYLMPHDIALPQREDVVGVIAPDHGALTRATLYKNAYCADAQQLLSCVKSRDSATGRLSNYVMPRLAVPGRYLIVDDICDGGGTFNLLVEAFKKDPLAERCQLEMFVSHGIFSKGLDAIDPLIDHITTTDSWCALPSSERLTVVPLLPKLLNYLGATVA